jgi:hypothetical protein
VGPRGEKGMGLSQEICASTLSLPTLSRQGILLTMGADSLEASLGHCDGKICGLRSDLICPATLQYFIYVHSTAQLGRSRVELKQAYPYMIIDKIVPVGQSLLCAQT